MSGWPFSHPIFGRVKGVATYVLVHNGFAGAWVWRQVEGFLRQNGHEVHSPTLTGLGERQHLANPDVDLTTHIADVLGTIRCEELTNVILVGSSPSSTVIAGLAELIPDRIKVLVFVDAPIPKDGQSWFDIIGTEVSAKLLEAAQLHGNGWRVPRTDVQPPRWVPHPLASVTQKLRLVNPAAARISRTMIHCTERPPDWFFGLGGVIDQAAEDLRHSGGKVISLEADHLPQLSQPSKLARLLASFAPS